MTGSQIFSNFKESKEPIQFKLLYARYTVYDQEFARSLRCSYSNEPSVFTKSRSLGLTPQLEDTRRAVQSKMLASCGSLVLVLETSFYTKKAVKGVQESGGV